MSSVLFVYSNSLWKKSGERIFLQKREIMIIERTRNEIIFRLPSSTKLDDLQDLANLFEFKELAKKSTAKQKEVDALVSNIKKGRWLKTSKMIGL